MIKRNPIMAARRNPTMVANPARGIIRHNPMHGMHRGFAPRHNPEKSVLDILKNPQDIELAGVKVLPLAGGAIGAILIEETFKAVPFLNDIAKDSPKFRALLPAVASVGAGWALHKYLADKYPIASDIGGMLAAVGIVFAVRSISQGFIEDGIKSVASGMKKDTAKAAAAVQQAAAPAAPASAAAAAPEAGHGMSGGGFVPRIAMQPGAAVSGGQFHNFLDSFTAVEGTALSGYVMGGAVGGQAPTGLGARLAGSGLGGIDPSTFAD